MDEEREVVSSEEREAIAGEGEDVEAHALTADDKSALPLEEDEERRVFPTGD